MSGPPIAKAPLSPTSGLNARVRELLAEGHDISVLTAGEPPGPPPEHVRAAAARAAQSPTGHGYGPPAGMPELRAWVAAATPAAGDSLDLGNVVVTGGAKSALFATFLALLAPGDGVLVPTPSWPTYGHAVRLAGGRTLTVPTTSDSGFQPTVELLDQHHDDAVRLLLLCSPSNPTGAVLAADRLREIGAWCARHRVTVVLDQIYGRLGWTDPGRPARAVLREAGADVVVVDGVSKTYAMTGWRIGWLVAPTPVAGAVTAVLSHTANHPNRIAQTAALAALEGDQEQVTRLRGHLLDNRARLGRTLAAVPDVLDYREPEGGFYAFPSLAPLLAHRPELSDAATVARMLLDEAGVAVVPGGSFGAPQHLRVSFVEPAAEFERAVTRMTGYLKTRLRG
ncbi:pyridoxal phosphate-dependent aminotransferase [Streptomyces profundus]|uniref:pyridoxal phosphate-dependent aminotransferase n=1 Tax=Streptomyces profundus TaxID=2867410 RepID=UPI001D161F6E|nr:aminotransferase class I/II-fold pyridoxal phosphate-dependent enzyme [Streptomyces sp. MA3_2.13]UED88008.1 aminotransferase class I/II-fold pyridoxal phosphate-dependent enzyme [Streptomyces sp. MA3_2.13]